MVQQALCILSGAEYVLHVLPHLMISGIQLPFLGWQRAVFGFELADCRELFQPKSDSLIVTTFRCPPGGSVLVTPLFSMST